MSPLNGPFQRARQRLIAVEFPAHALWAALGAALVLSAGMWLDLLWELSPAARMASDVSALLAAGGVVGWLALRTWQRGREALLARLLDSAGGTGGVILSGWELAAPTQSGSQSPLTERLAELAVERAGKVAAQIPLQSAIPGTPLRRALAATAAAIALILIVCLVAPALVATQVARFANPNGNVPPYSSLSFEVTPADTELVYGQDLDIHAHIVGKPSERVELVVSSEGKESLLPMFEQAEGAWRTTLSRVTQPTAYRVRSGRSRTRDYHITLLTVPRLEEVKFKIMPPAYTRNAVYEGPLPQQGLVGLAGTRVEIVARSNRPLKAGSCKLLGERETSSIELQPAAKDAEEVRGEFVLNAPGRFELRVQDVQGQTSQETITGSIIVLDDQRPLVRILSPPAMSLATPNAKLPVVMAAEDDFGVARLQLYRSLNDSRSSPAQLPVQSPPPRRLQTQQILPMASYGLYPGDEIKLFARVEDNDPASSKGSECPVIVVRIISQVEFERMLRTREGLEVLMSKYQQAQRRMEALAEKLEEMGKALEKHSADEPLSADQRQALQNLADEIEAQEAEVLAAQKHLLPFDLDPKLSEHLEKLAKTMHESAQEARELAKNEPQLNRDALEALRRLADKLSQGKKNFEAAATKPLAHLAKVFPLLADQARFEALVQKQKDLAQRASSLKDQELVADPAAKARMRDWEEEQHALREELDQLLNDIADHVTQLPNDKEFAQLRESADMFRALVRGSDALTVMFDAETAIGGFQGTRGHEMTQAAAELLMKFMSQCKGIGEAGEGCLKFNPSLSENLGNTIQQLLGEMGLGSGGSGFSVRGNGLGRMGLYGDMPGGMSSGKMGGGFGKETSPGGRQSGFSQHTTGDSEVGDTTAASESVGTQGSTIPPRYRKRVNEYFQRINEEASR